MLQLPWESVAPGHCRKNPGLDAGCPVTAQAVTNLVREDMVTIRIVFQPLWNIELSTVELLNSVPSHNSPKGFERAIDTCNHGSNRVGSNVDLTSSRTQAMNMLT